MTRTTRGRQLSEEQRAERAEQRKAEMEAAHAKLSDAIKELLTPEGWMQLINSRRWLRKYTLNNQLMIQLQCPGATDVRPYGNRNRPQPESWLAVGRYARAGETALRIYAPIFRKNDDGEQVLIGFKLVPVFDVSQTDGRPLPEDPHAQVRLLDGDAPSLLQEGTEKLIADAGFSFTRGPCEGGANGITEWGPRRVTVRADVSDAQAAKTTIHELAHIRLGHEKREVSRERKEVEAESVACIVASVAGLTTLSYSVPYVAGSAEDAEAVENSAKIVLKTADRILEELGL